MPDKKIYKKRLPKKVVSIANKGFFDEVRRKLKLTEEELSDKTIEKVVKLNGELIGEWVVNHTEGFAIRNNGRLAVSKWMPKSLRGDSKDIIETLSKLPKYKNLMKARIERYKRVFTNWNEGEPYTNLHSFFYMYKALWFNKDNTAFDKAKLYKLTFNSKVNKAINQKVKQGKDYMEFQFDDFRIVRRKRAKEKQ